METNQNLGQSATPERHAHPADAWLFAIPDDPYAPCPCGCGKAFRYVAKAGEDEIQRHYEVFARKFMEGKGDCQ